MPIKRPLLFTFAYVSDCSCFGWVFKMFQLQNAIVAIVCNWTLKFTQSNGEWWVVKHQQLREQVKNFKAWNSWLILSYLDGVVGAFFRRSHSFFFTWFAWVDWIFFPRVWDDNNNTQGSSFVSFLPHRLLGLHAEETQKVFVIHLGLVSLLSIDDSSCFFKDSNESEQRSLSTSSFWVAKTWPL